MNSLMNNFEICIDTAIQEYKILETIKSSGQYRAVSEFLKKNPCNNIKSPNYSVFPDIDGEDFFFIDVGCKSSREVFVKFEEKLKEVLLPQISVGDNFVISFTRKADNNDKPSGYNKISRDLFNELQE